MYQNIDSTGDVFKRVSCYSIKKSTVSYFYLHFTTNVATLTYVRFMMTFHGPLLGLQMQTFSGTFSICVFAIIKQNVVFTFKHWYLWPWGLMSEEQALGRFLKNRSWFRPKLVLLLSNHMKKKAIYFKVFIYIPQKCNLRHQQKRNFIYDHFHFLIVGKFFHNLWNCFPFSISKADAAASSKCMHLYFDIPCFLLPQLYVVYYYCKRYQQSSFATGRTVVTVNCQEYL